MRYPHRTKDVFNRILLKDRFRANVPRFGGPATPPPDVGNPENAPHADDLWISTDDAAEYAAYIDAKVNELGNWLSLGEEPEDLAKAIGESAAAKFFVQAASYAAWAGRWKLANQGYSDTDYIATWDLLVQWHKELKAYADDFQKLFENASKPVAVPSPGPVPGESTKVGPGENKEESDLVVGGLVVAGVLGLFFLLKK